MLGKLRSDASLESDAAMKKGETLRKQTEKKEKKEKQKSNKTEERAEEEETVSPKAKQVKKKAEPSEVDMNSPKSKRQKRKTSHLKMTFLLKPKEPIDKKAVSSKTKKVTKNEEPSEEEIDAPKPKKMKKEKEMNGETGEKSPKLKNGFPHPELDCNPSEAASEESNSDIDQEISVEQKKALSLIFPSLKKLLSFSKQRLSIMFITGREAVPSGTAVSGLFYGRTLYGGQFERMRNGIDILVGTPGRIKDHIQSGKLDLTKLKHVVLDEVDQMLDMGFADQVEEILSVAYKKDSEDNPQTLLFSATCPHWVFNVAKKYIKSTYERVDLIGKKTQKTAITVEHLAIKCHWTQRAAVIGDVIRVYSGHQGRTIIFCETKKEAQELSQNSAIKQDAQSLHGDIPQKQREITLKGFRNGSFGVLVATNVAARGLDIPEVDLVIQNSPPKDVESYIHRSGRTGRAGRTGVCICFYQHKEEYQLVHVEQKVGIKFKRIGVPSATEMIKASSKDAIRLLDSVPPTAISHFKQSAEKLIEEKGAVEALAAAPAHISGATSVDQRSLINSNVGFVTMILQCSIEMPNISHAWKELKEQLGEEIDSKVKGMVFLKGKLGVCFDVPTTSVTEIQEKWHDSRRWQLSVATEHPELEGPREGYGGFRGQRDGNRRFRGQREGSRGPRGQRSGGGNKSNRSQNKGQKRSFSKAFGQ
uniref:RNA helicase n=1 Tax=Rhinopithecus bieti TaxID=61621 RepID=A0A2K6LK65_RHIBE